MEQFIIYIARILLRVFYIFPIRNNRLLFSCYEGKSYSCNPKYIFESLYSDFRNKCQYVWVVKDRKLIPEEYKDIICVKYLSIKHLYYSITSKVIVNNVGIEPIIPKRKSQIFINTWHGGGAYKKGPANAKFKRALRAGMTDYVISSCQAFTDTHSMRFDIGHERFLPIGMPRNDVFFTAENHRNIRHKICKLYNIDENKLLILYAPTFRGYFRNPQQFNVSEMHPIHDAVLNRFKKESVILYRAHLGDKIHLNNAIDVAAYQDMQDLLVAADIFITDYSSSIWDYSFTYKPGFLYTPDISEYEESTGFYIPIAAWPYNCAQTIEELCANIINYEEHGALQRIQKHHTMLGSFETGHATKDICDIIKSYVKYK